MKYLSPRALNISPYTPGEQPRDRKYIKLNTNENAYPPSPCVQAALEGMATRLRAYPDPDCTALRQVIAERHGLDPHNVFVGNGSDEVLAFAFAALAGPEGVLSVDVGYTFYPVYAELFDIDYHTVPVEDDLSVPWQKLIANRTVALANPNAPTSLALDAQSLLSLIDGLRAQGRALILDEAYCDFGGASMAGEVSRLDNLLVVRTLSKSHALAGLRVGYALGDRALIDGLERIKNSFNSYTVDALAQAAAAAALKDESYFCHTRDRIVDTRDRFIAQLRARGFDVPESSTNFVFPRHERVPARALFEGLRARGILVRYFDRPRISDRLRITIGTDAEMEAVISALDELIS